jgi:hypothetical protein
MGDILDKQIAISGGKWCILQMGIWVNVERYPTG